MTKSIPRKNKQALHLFNTLVPRSPNQVGGQSNNAGSWQAR